MGIDHFAATVFVPSQYFEEYRERIRTTADSGLLTLLFESRTPGGDSDTAVVLGDPHRYHLTVTRVHSTSAALDPRNRMVKPGFERLLLALKTREPIKAATIAQLALLDADKVLTDIDVAAYLEREPAAEVMPPYVQEATAALTVWVDAMMRTPIVCVHHSGSEKELLAAQAAARNALPACVRPYVPVIALDDQLRRLVSDMFSVEHAGEPGHPDKVTVPANAVSVIGAAGPDADPRQQSAIYGKSPLPKFDGRRIYSAYREACAHMPDLSVLIVRAFQNADADPAVADIGAAEPSTGQAVSPTEAAALERVAALEGELSKVAAARDRLKRRVTELEREVRALSYALRRHEGAVDDAEDDVVEHDVEDAPDASSSREDMAVYQRLLSIEVPDTMEALCVMARQHLEHVHLSPSVFDSARALDAHPDTGSWKDRAWRSLAAMEAYAIAQREGHARGDFRKYAASLPTPPVSTKHIVMHESQTVETNRAMREERTFAVPVEVDPSGRVYMAPHIRVGASGASPAPRLHFYDDTRGQTGQMHVGYIGPHLTNTIT